MLQPGDLPPILGLEPFSVVEGLDLGVSPGNLRSRQLQHPFYGTRSVGLDLSTANDSARAYSPRLRPGDVFSHDTAARLWSLPLPLYIGNRIHVSAATPGRAPETRGVVGHQLTLEAGDVQLLHGLPLTSPALTWSIMAGVLRVEDLVALGDAVVTPPFRSTVSLATIDDLRREVQRGPGKRGQQLRELAIDQIRRGPLSRTESLVRVLCALVGIPEPELNVNENDLMPDLRWLRYRVCLEYQGKGHRSARQFSRDIGRTERQMDLEWLVMKVAAEDLFDRPEQLVSRLARRLRSRGWVGTLDMRQIVRFVR